MHTYVVYAIQFHDPRDPDLGWMDTSNPEPMDTEEAAHIAIAVKRESNTGITRPMYRIVKRTITEEVLFEPWLVVG